VLRRFFAHRSVELLLSGLVGVLKQQDSNSSDVIPGLELPAVKTNLLVSIEAICGMRFRSSLAVQGSGSHKKMSQPGMAETFPGGQSG
jgi:hypothetical protein